ncbi:MAG: ATP-binding protein [Planctomycetota bacterium]
MRWFEAIVGHSRAKEILGRAIERDRVPPALLVTGRDGVGRCTVATELAKAVMCRGPAPSSGGDVRPCGNCVPCNKIAAGTHPDFVRVELDEGKSEISIAQVRALLDELALAPVEARRRVFVIDRAELMNDFAQDALLKSLEEPPARALLILIARHESALLRTIQSRCFLLALGELETSDVERVLVAKGVEAGEARTRAAWSGGSPGVGLRERHPERIAAARALVDALVSGEARRNPLAVAADLVARAAAKNLEPSVRREGALDVTDLLGRVLRDALASATDPGARLLSGADPKSVARLAQAGADRVATAIDSVQKVEESIANNQNVNLALEGLVLDVSAAICLAQEAAVARR